MTGKIPPILGSVCKALILVCLSGVVLLPLAAVKSEAAGSRDDSIGYARQTICDLSLLPNGRVGLRKLQSPWNAGSVYGIAHSLYELTLHPARADVPFSVELLKPQSLAICNPTTRSPPV